MAIKLLNAILKKFQNTDHNNLFLLESFFMSLISSFFTFCETKKITFDFIGWLFSRFVSKEKRWSTSRYITFFPYYYLTKRRAKFLSDEKNHHLAVNGITSISGNTYLSDYVNFNGMLIQGSGKVIFGKYFHSGENCRIITQNHNYEGNKIPYDETMIIKDVEIGDFVWIGTNVLILPGAKIGEGAIIQAGSVVSGTIPSCAIAGGNPCKVFKYRNKEHFLELKEKQKFL